MTYRLPQALQTPDDTQALEYLRTYYGRNGGRAYTGSYFDDWGGEQDPDRFTAEDVVAVTFLSVVVPPMAAHRLLVEEAELFTGLLKELGPDRDLVDEDQTIDPDWPGRRLNRALQDRLVGVGPTIASKLCARKRPRMIPIYDSVVRDVTDARLAQWEPLRNELRAGDGALHERLLRLRDEVGLDERISAIRVYDVITWMEGKQRNLRPTEPDEQPGAALPEE
ncbi:DUF6308 family protein [Geodermatophilus sabuli]|uniref:Uncharacterized protein n=1 Tax=Geodermatophilus sabuli TaxID=1564158 RepID=A0A285EEW6_9ACTN|nr:DUF6308 family protein [Geodermatophilus sabuli]MBB3086666.1 hypothetical protein [Geodermatophilus sabuli]SNX97682.1 hypothetical protein SAMN06893097_10847 [Geodermatophilus sabuli]